MSQSQLDRPAERQPAMPGLPAGRLSGRRLVPVVVALLVLGIAVLLPTAFRFRRLELEAERLSQYWPPVAELLSERYQRLGERWEAGTELSAERRARWQQLQQAWSLGAIDLRRQQPLAVELERLATELAGEAAESRSLPPIEREAVGEHPAWLEFDAAASKLRAATEDPLGRLTSGMLGLRYPVDLQLSDL
jgi:hypothetical protein